MCVPFRGNIPIAALMTFVSIPPTTLFVFLPGAIWVGNRFGFHADVGTVSQMMDSGASMREWISWLGTDAAPSLVLGLGVIALLAAAAGYAVSAVGWRWWTAHKRRTRLLRMAAQDYPD